MTVLRREQYPPREIGVREAPLMWQIGHLWGNSIWQSGQLAGRQVIGYQQQFSFLGHGVTFADRFVPLALWLLGVFYQLRGNWRVGASMLTTLLINSVGLMLLLNFTDHEVRDRDLFLCRLLPVCCAVFVARCDRSAAWTLAGGGAVQGMVGAGRRGLPFAVASLAGQRSLARSAPRKMVLSTTVAGTTFRTTTQRIFSTRRSPIPSFALTETTTPFRCGICRRLKGSGLMCGWSIFPS